MPAKLVGAALALLLLSGASAATAEQETTEPHAGHSLVQTAGSTRPGEPADDLQLAAAERLDRAELIAAVLARNPGVEEARLAARAASERVLQATTLDDPMLSYGIAPLSIGSNDVQFGQALEARQRLPYPGKLRRMGDAARSEAEAAALDVETVRLDLAVAASTLYDDYYLVHRALEVNAEHQRLVEGYKRVVTARYAAGEAPQQAPIQAEIELSHLVHDAMVLDTEREIAMARINALLHRAPVAPLPPPAEHLAVPDLSVLDEDGIAAAAIAARPELARLDAEKAARETTVELRELDRYPDFEAMAQYSSMWRETEHRFMVGVGINLPIHRDRIDAGVAEAEAELSRVESERARRADEIGAEARVAWLRLREAHHVLEIYADRLLPAAGDEVRAAVSGFETGQVPFQSLLEAERNQRSVELSYEEMLTDLYRRGAELDRALGRAPGAWMVIETPVEDRTETEAGIETEGESR